MYEKLENRSTKGDPDVSSDLDQDEGSELDVDVASALDDDTEDARHDRGLKGEASEREVGADLVTEDSEVDEIRSRENDAYKSAEQALEDTEKEGILDQRRASSEAAAKSSVGGNAENLDGTASANYPTYDISSSEELASVKTHWTKEGDPNVKAYIQDFEKMSGWNRAHKDGLTPLEQDARRILQAHAQQDVPIPTGLADRAPDDLSIATSDDLHDAAEWLGRNSVLRIPDDHLPDVREELKARMLQHPDNYYLEEADLARVDHIVAQRVQGIGVDSSQLQEMIDRKQEEKRGV